MKSQAESAARAFSLMELLMAIGIISVLSVLLFPIGKKMLQKADSTKCLSNMRQIGTGFHAYLAENNMIIPTQRSASAGGAPPTGGQFFALIGPYCGWPATLPWGTTAAKNTFMHCPAHTEQPGSFSYRFSSFLVGDTASTTASVPNRPLSYIIIRSPQNKVLAWEIHTLCAWPMTSSYNVGTGKTPFTPLFSANTYTHHVSSNYLFVDGHVEARGDSLSNWMYWAYDQ